MSFFRKIYIFSHFVFRGRKTKTNCRDCNRTRVRDDCRCRVTHYRAPRPARRTEKRRNRSARLFGNLPFFFSPLACMNGKARKSAYCRRRLGANRLRSFGAENAFQFERIPAVRDR